MRKDILWAVVGVALAMGYLYYRDTKNGQLRTEPLSSKPTAVMVPANSGSPQTNATLAGAASKAVAKAAVSLNPQQIEQIQKNFVVRLKELSQCLNIKMAADSEKIDPTFDNLVVGLRPSMGDVIVMMEDWTQKDLQAADGSLTRLRTETSYEDTSNAPTRRVQFFKMNQQKEVEMQPLDPEKATNPSDEYLEILKAGALTLLEEKAGRAYFQEGEEIVMIERNGQLESLNITKGSKTVSCSGLDSINSNCQCEAGY